MVTSCQQNKATHTHKTKSENDAYIFLIQLLRAHNTFERSTLYESCCSWVQSVQFFSEHNVVFCQCGFENLEVLENWSRSKVGFINPWNHTEQWISQPIFAGRKVLLTLKQLFEVFVKLSVFNCNRATCISLWGQNQRWVTSEWVNARKTSKISWESILQSHQSDHSGEKAFRAFDFSS